MIGPIGRTERRVIGALLVVAIVPLLTAMWLADTVVQRVSDTAFHPDVGRQFERSLGVYADLVKSMKRAMRQEAAAIAAQPPLRRAAEASDAASLPRALDAVLSAHPTLLRVEVDQGDRQVVRARATPHDPARERPFTVAHPLGEGDDAAQLTLVFAADRRRIDEMEDAQRMFQAYRGAQSTHRPSNVWWFVAILGLTVLLAVVTGLAVVRPVTKRIAELAEATEPVAGGDLSVRVDERGDDELASLARAFNQMLSSLGRSRARVEFLKRVGEWQTMARRLAHEIKNPLTPIQLAVEECQRRYEGDDPRFRTLLDTTRDIVVEEVEGLRKLVSEFAAFARLPKADLEDGDLGDFLREQKPRVELDDRVLGAGAPVRFDVPDEPMPVALDRTMLYRVVINLVANAAQAMADDGADGEVAVRATADAHGCDLVVEDEGPGIPDELRATLFDPYVTTKDDGTGLGLTIVKKIVLDHGGHIDVEETAAGGASFRVRLPRLGSAASAAAQHESTASAVTG